MPYPFPFLSQGRQVDVVEEVLVVVCREAVLVRVESHKMLGECSVLCL